jgi:hypothetical protein
MLRLWLENGMDLHCPRGGRRAVSTLIDNIYDSSCHVCLNLGESEDMCAPWILMACRELEFMRTDAHIESG